MATSVLAQQAPRALPAEAEARPQVVAVEVQLGPGAAEPEDVRVDVLPGRPLSLREVRKTLVRYYDTGQYSSAVVRAVPVPGGVKVVFELRAKRGIKRVTVAGNRALSDAALVKIGGFGAKAEYSPELLRRGVERINDAYHRHGYEQAAASANATEDAQGVSLALRVSEGLPTVLQRVVITGEPGLPLQRILRLTNLSEGLPLDRAALAEGLEALKAEYRQRRYHRALVGEPVIEVTGQAAAVSLPLISGPRYVYHFHQNHQVPDAVLEAVLAYDGTEPLDDPLLSRLSRRLQVYYQSRGWFDAHVWPQEVERADGGEAVVTFEVEEGTRIPVGELTFQGNRLVSTPELRGQVRAAVERRELLPAGARSFDSLQLEGRGKRPGVAEAPPLEPERVYSEDAYREAAEAITNLYRNRGYLAARVQVAEARADFRLRQAKVRFTVEEGPQTTVSSIGVDGLPAGMEVPRSAQPLQKGDPLSVALLERGRRELLERLVRDGYLYARVEPDTRGSGDGTRMDVTYRVDPGPQVRVGQVSLRGTERSDKKVVLANMPLKPGDLLTPERLLESQRALVNLGAYRQVAVRLDQPELAEAQKDVRVEVQERPLTEGEVGIGISAVDGPRILLDGAYPNLFGQALNLEARGKVHWIGAGQAFSNSFGLHTPELRDFSQASSWYGVGGKLALTARAPRVRFFLPAGIGAHVDLIGEREFRPSFQFASLAGIAGLDWQATSSFTAALQYNLELDRVCTYQLRGQSFDCGTGGLADLLTDQDRRFIQFGSFLLHSLTPSIALDLRDDPANPSRGLVVSGSAELTSSLLEQFPLLGVKAQGNVTGYLPLGRRIVLAGSLRGGRFFPLGTGSSALPAQKRFYLGGFTSLRGFAEDGLLAEDRRANLRSDRQACEALVSRSGCAKSAIALLGGSQIPSEGGETYTLLKVELRFPFSGALDLGLFFEAGNLWSDSTQYRPFVLRPVAGGGLRYETPIGPLALDLGANLAPDRAVNEPTFTFHFNIGLF
ncbi:MAG TPA: POTRA domain-containing protein [Myxococcales bacterium]|nr:POTRA domain-containing protein [Myxococcales bacterium]